MSGVVQIVHGRWQSRDIGDVVRPWIVAVEQIEELDERHHLPALPDLERPGDAEVNLDVRRSAELVYRRLHTVDYCAIVRRIAQPVHVHRSRQSNWTGGLCLNQRRHLEATGNVHDSRQGEAADDIFSRW